MTSQTSGRRGLRSVSPAIATPRLPPSIPRDVPDLVGREDVLATVAEVLTGGRERLVTLVGTGGVGKTRLAVELARRLAPVFDGSVLFVPLSSVSDPDLVLPAVVTAAGWAEQSARPALAVLAERIGDDPTLLVLDNLEQVLPAAAALDVLLGSCSGLVVLATSRAALRSRSERTVTVAPLAVPQRGSRGPALRSVATNEAVALLVQAARRFDRTFELTSDNAAAIAEICVRLDGLPLALELAAARLRLISPHEMVGLLGRHLDLLRGADPAAPPHHRTLRATIDWSYRSLPDEDRSRFAALGVFAGGFELHAAAQVTRTDVYELLDSLERLVDQHLVTSVDAGAERRFHVLETLRAYAIEQLAAAGDHTSACDAHADWCVGLVDAASADLTGPQQAEALRRLDREHDNIVAAISWLMSAPSGRTPPDERVLRLAAGMWRYWWIRGHAADGRARIERALSCREWSPTAALADAAYAAGELAEALGDVPGARAHLQRALEVRSSLDDAVGCATCRNSLGYLARAAGELDAAEELHGTALRDLRAAGAARGVAIALNGLAAVAYVRGDLATASARWEETTEVVRALGDRMMLALQLSNLGMARTANGELDAAVVAYEESLATAREFGDVNATLFALTNLGAVLVELGDLDAAAELLDEALATVELVSGMLGGVAHDTYGVLEARRGHPRAAAGRFVAALDVFTALGDDEHTAGTLEHLAGVAAEVGAWEATIGFLAAADRRRASSGSVPVGADATARASARAAAGAAMPPSEVASVVAAGTRWTADEVAARARAFADRLPEAAPHVGSRAADPLQELGLTAREAEVARRLVDRRTDREIADELALSLRTVTTHVSAVLRKLGVSSRRDVEAAVEERTRGGVALGR